MTQRAPTEGHGNAQFALGFQSPLGESERYARLREQAHRPMELPPGLARFCIGSELAQDQIETALRDWSSARDQLRSGAPFTTAEHLFFLTILLSPKLDLSRRRKLLESAAEVLVDPRQRQIVRCLLVQCAVLGGDLESAETWLRPCDPRPLDLHMDTAWRLAAAYVYTARNEPSKVLECLGGEPGAVPIADGHDATATVLRVNALERMNRGAEARTQLGQVARARPTGYGDVLEALQTNQVLGLCATTWKALGTPFWQETERKLRPNPGSGELVGLGGLALIALAGFGVLIARVTGVISREWTHSIAGSGPHASPEGFIMFCTVLGLLALIGAGVWLRSSIRARQLRARGVMMLARLVSMQDAASTQAGLRFFTLEFETLPQAGQTPTRFTHAISLATAPTPGRYAVLFDPVDPPRSRVLLA